MGIGAFEAKNRLGALLDAAERGEVITITRHGRPVARLVPAADPAPVEARRAALARIRARADARSAEARGPFRFDWDAWKALRDEGRP